MSFAAHVLTHRRFRRRHLLGLFLLVVAVAWATLWGIAAASFDRNVDALIATAKASGATFAYDKRSMDGTPLTIHVHLEKFHYHQGESLDLAAGEAVLYFHLWDWGNISAKFRNDIKGQVNGLPFAADVLKLAVAKPEHPPLNHMDAGLNLWGQGLGVNLTTQQPLPLGNRMDQISFDLRVMGPVPDFTNQESVRAWNNASGVIEFDQLDIAWGPMGLSAKGTVGLNAALQPEGAFSGKVDGLDNVVDMLVSQNIIEPRQEALLRSSISVLAHPSGMMGSSAPIVPISIQDGGLYLGPVKLFNMPKLRWPGTPVEETVPQEPL